MFTWFIDNPDFKFYEVGDSDWETRFTVWVLFKAITPTPPATVPAELALVSVGQLSTDAGYIKDLTWYVPRTFYKLTQVNYFMDGGRRILNGFELIYSCEDATFVTVGWTNFRSRCFGTCYGVTGKLEIPIDKEIV